MKKDIFYNNKLVAKKLGVEELSTLGNVDKKINVVWGGKPYRKREVMNLWVNGENLPNWKPKISLEEGLKLFK